ncbi:hypothetical protein [Lacimonas salitolerans]|uniref:Uncharacterized protein n=1 Tax=Lacimonas salitolerans TaxID=1323750 RepID=A0ABW4EJ01_9RHOB
MKRLLATTAVATMAFAGAASAQSVLERVLGQIDNATNLASVNGTFANIAENIGVIGGENQYVVPTGLFVDGIAEDGDGAITITQAQFDNIVDTAANDLIAGITEVGEGDDLRFVVEGDFGGGLSVPANAFVTREAAEAFARQSALTAATASVLTVIPGTGTILNAIDGSINNVIEGLDEALQTASVGDVSAIEFVLPTVEFGDMATTALGAVNTGDITLGVNSSVEEAKTSTTGAINAVVDQLGGSEGTGAIVLNIASNATDVIGSVNNTLTGVNGKVGDLSTTALGAVNTGTIVSGVDAAVAGIVGSTSGGAAVATE